jgi:hypothetical protein
MDPAGPARRGFAAMRAVAGAAVVEIQVAVRRRRADVSSC